MIDALHFSRDLDGYILTSVLDGQVLQQCDLCKPSLIQLYSLARSAIWESSDLLTPWLSTCLENQIRYLRPLARQLLQDPRNLDRFQKMLCNDEVRCKAHPEMSLKAPARHFYGRSDAVAGCFTGAAAALIICVACYSLVGKLICVRISNPHTNDWQNQRHVLIGIRSGQRRYD